MMDKEQAARVRKGSARRFCPQLRMRLGTLRLASHGQVLIILMLSVLVIAAPLLSRLDPA